MSRRSRWLASRAAALLLVVLGCGPDAEAEAGREPPPTPVRTVVATSSTRPDPIRTSGILSSRTEMGLAFKIQGYVDEILVDEGDRASAGQLLARLRTDEVDAAVRAAEARSELAAMTLGRIERLRADSVATQAMLDQARQDHEQAQAALMIARFNQSSAAIRAPSDGRVLERMIEVAEFVGPQAPAFRFGTTEGGWVVRVDLADRQVVRLAPGDSAVVSVPAVGQRLFAARVGEIGESANPRAGTFEVEIGLEGDAPSLRSGMVARVTIVPDDSEELTFLPTRALVDTEGMEAAVFVVEGDSVRRHRVRVVRIGPESVGIRAPELEGAVVVTDGAAYLREGERVDDRTADLEGNGAGPRTP